MMNPRKSVGTAYLAYSGRLLAEVADALRKSDDAANYRDTAANAVKPTARRSPRTALSTLTASASMSAPLPLPCWVRTKAKPPPKR